RVLAHLKVCMGKRIVEVRLSECTDDNTLNTIDELFNGIQFRQLAVSCQTLSDAAQYEYSFVDRRESSSSSQLGCLSLSLESRTRTSPLSNRLDLPQRWNHAVPYFLGHLNFNWGPLIHEMFSRKLDKLHIENRYYPKYLSRSCA
ncbi:hypothetical protein PENTCL1PPCAC_9756, partial [Pristionchus entomophagus]